MTARQILCVAALIAAIISAISAFTDATSGALDPLAWLAVSVGLLSAAMFVPFTRGPVT